MRFLLLFLSLVLKLNISGYANFIPQEIHVIKTHTSQKHRLSVTINRNGENKVDCPFRFQRQYEDSETGLYNNRFRYYSPDEGMYLSQDPSKVTLYGGAQKTVSIPEGLIVIHTPSKANPMHFDIIPKELNIYEGTFQNLLNQIKI